MLNMIRYYFIFLLVLFIPIIYTYSQPPRISWQEQVLAPKKPIILVFSTRANSASTYQTWFKLLRNDSIIDFWLGLEVIAVDHPETKNKVDWLKSIYSLDGVQWALIGKDGKLLDSGGKNPNPKILSQILHMAGESNPIERLESFLLQHPDHQPTRLSLIQYLANRVAGKHQIIPKEQLLDLSTEQDADGWGPVVEHIERLLQSEARVSAILDLDKFLPQGDWERFSPLMRGLYYRLRPLVTDVLRNVPQNNEAFSLLLRIDRVLDENTSINIFSSVTPFQTPFHPRWVPASLPTRLIESSRSTGDWRKVLPILKSCWKAMDAYELGGRASLGSGDSSPTRVARDRQRFAELWSGFLLPLIEALVRTGAENEVKQLLASLDDRWSLVDLPSWAVRAAQRLQREDLAEQWKQACRRSTPAPLKINPFASEYFLLCLEEPPRQIVPGYRALATLGYRISWPITLKPYQRQAILNAGSPVWMLLGADGRPALSGAEFPTAEVLLAQLRNTGLNTPLEAIRDFLNQNPGHLIATEARSNEVLRIALSMEEQIAQPPQFTTKEFRFPSRSEVWQEYTSALRFLVEHPFGSLVMANSLPRFPAPETQIDDSLTSLKKLAQDYLPKLERELTERPTDTQVWERWMAFGHLVGRPMRPLLDRVNFGPVPHPSNWDLEWQVEQYATLLAQDGRWEQIITELTPGWDSLQERVRFGLNSKSSNYDVERAYQQLLVPLVMAHLHLGSSSKADRYVRAWASMGLTKASPTAILAIAEALGYRVEANNWRDLFAMTKR